MCTPIRNFLWSCYSLNSWTWIVRQRRPRRRRRRRRALTNRLVRATWHTPPRVPNTQGNGEGSARWRRAVHFNQAHVSFLSLPSCLAVAASTNHNAFRRTAVAKQLLNVAAQNFWRQTIRSINGDQERGISERKKKREKLSKHLRRSSISPTSGACCAVSGACVIAATTSRRFLLSLIFLSSEKSKSPSTLFSYRRTSRTGGLQWNRRFIFHSIFISKSIYSILPNIGVNNIH